MLSYKPNGSSNSPLKKKCRQLVWAAGTLLFEGCRLFGGALAFDFVEDFHNGIAEGANGHAGIVGQM